MHDCLHVCRCDAVWWGQRLSRRRQDERQRDHVQPLDQCGTHCTQLYTINNGFERQQRYVCGWTFYFQIVFTFFIPGIDLTKIYVP